MTQGNVAHAYLFVGPPHVGKFTIARWFARELLLTDVLPEKREEAAHAIHRLLHPDLLVLDQLWIEDVCEDWERIALTSNVSQQHRAKGNPAKTDTIGIDDIRAIQERIYDSRMGTFSCCLIRGAERITAPAANAFLKILEEPPEGRVFILTAQSLGDLLPTVVSRMRTIHFTTLPEEELAELVRDRTPEERIFFLQCARGAPGKLLTLLHDPDLLRTERMMHAEALAFWKSDALLEKLHLLKRLLKREYAADRFLLHLALAMRDSGTTLSPSACRSFHDLCRDLQTNAHRELLVQRFVLAVMQDHAKENVTLQHV